MAGHLVTKEVEKADNATCASVFTDNFCLQESQAPATHGKVWAKEDLLSQEKDQVREHINKPDPEKSLGPDGLHP